jgi:hypothetical protein
MSNWNWLEETLDLQRTAFKIDPPALEGDEFADYVIWNHTAAVAELTEFLEENNWKPWSSIRGRGDRDAAIGELIDVQHFIANLLVALDCTDEEYEVRYQMKMQVNRNRQKDGYDGQNKCPRCRRALDDAGVLCTPTNCYGG